MQGFSNLNGFTKYHKFTESNDYSSSGLTYNDSNFEEQKKPKKKEININSQKNKYSKFVYEKTFNFKNNRLIKNNHDFIKTVIDPNYYSPELYILIEKIQILSNKIFESTVHLNDRSLVDLEKDIKAYVQTKNPSSNELSIIHYIKAALSSLMLRYHSANEKALVIDLEKFLELTKTQINNWQTIAKQDVREFTEKITKIIC